MAAVLIAGLTLLVVAIVLIIGTGGVRTPPAIDTTDKDTRDMPGYLD